MSKRTVPSLKGCGHRVWHDHQLHHEERHRPGAGPQDCPCEQGLANGDLSPGDTGRAGWYRAQLYQRNISGVSQQRGDEASTDGLGEGRGMKIEEIKNVAVFFNLNGKTVALRMDAEQKRIVALMARNTADARAELIEVPHMTLPADPAMQEAAQ